MSQPLRSRCLSYPSSILNGMVRGGGVTIGQETELDNAAASAADVRDMLRPQHPSRTPMGSAVFPSAPC
jgi:hypothetical protein